MNYEPHPASSIFWMMSDAEYDRLKASIQTHGMRMPIVLCDGKILDGRNRHKACLELDIEPTFTEYTGDDPVGEVLALNAHRRGSGKSGQRALAAAILADAPNQRPNKSANLQTYITADTAAAVFGISVRALEYAKEVIGTPWESLVKDGEVSVNAARAAIVYKSDHITPEAAKIASVLERTAALPEEEKEDYLHQVLNAEMSRSDVVKDLASMAQNGNGQAAPYDPLVLIRKWYDQMIRLADTIDPAFKYQVVNAAEGVLEYVKETEE